MLDFSVKGRWELKGKRIFAGVILSILLSGCLIVDAAFMKDVRVREGTVAGTYDEAHATVKWLGVPYAKRAAGEGRFKGPRKAEKFKGVKDCSEPAPVNIQFNGRNVIGEEGVLTLDIYRPDTEEADLPVLVFFHGGNNQSSSSRLWVGDKFAGEANAVYVSAQYRLGVLGFNNLPALEEGTPYEKSGNYGLLDQAAALDWVKKNIKSFGGDPKNITVSGFSAGGRDVMAMLISPLFKGKFSKAISFSGGLTVADAEKSRKVIAAKLAPLAVKDGIREEEADAARWLLTDSDAVKNYLTNKKAEDLAPVMAGAVIRMSSFPHLYGDGTLLPKEGFATGNYHSVPLMMLASADEASSFMARDIYFKDRLDKIMTDRKTKDEFTFANRYGSRFYGYFNGQEAAKNIYDNYKDDIYVCTFAFGHDPEVVGEEYATKNGAIHGVFLPFLTDQPLPFTKGTDAFESEGAKELSKAFIATVASFMRTGNPNNSGMLPVRWEKWDPEKRYELVFDADKEDIRITLKESDETYAKILGDLENDGSLPDESKNYIIRHVLNGRWFSGGLDEKFGNADLWDTGF